VVLTFDQTGCVALSPDVTEFNVLRQRTEERNSGSNQNRYPGDDKTLN
jgi:hypothetical protein